MRNRFALHRGLCLCLVCLLLCLPGAFAEQDDSFFGGGDETAAQPVQPTPAPEEGEAEDVIVLGGDASDDPQLAAVDLEEGVTQGPQEEDSLRVWLQSLGQPQAIGLTLAGVYSVEGDRGFQFEPGTELSIGLDAENVRMVIKVGGAAIDMGGAFTLVRHLGADGDPGGLYIHEGEKDNLYSGDVTFKVQDGFIRTIVTISVEDYLYGVVPYEMSDLFPIEALKAQAIAARTYAMQRKTRRAAEEYHVVDTANDQVYKGLDERYESPIRAVQETRGIVGVYQGNYAECFFTASNGGQTALPNDVWGEGDFGYFDMRDDPYDLENPQSIVKTATIPKEGLEGVPEAFLMMLGEAAAEKLRGEGKLGENQTAEITAILTMEAKDPIYGGESRQYGTVAMTVQADSVELIPATVEGEEPERGESSPLEDEITLELSYYDQVRSPLEISINSQKYDLFELEETDDAFVLTARRFGHGVGMSQRGAQTMAAAYGMTYYEILAFYYPGLDFQQIQWQEAELTAVEQLPESLGYAAPRHTPAPTPAPLPPLQGDEYYATVAVEGTNSTLNVRGGPSTEDAIVGVLRNGARMIIEEETEDGWAKMKTVEVQGYVMMSFTEKE